MRSFAVAALIAGAVAMPAYEVESSSAPAYDAYPVETSSSAPAYAASTPVYSVASSSAQYEASSSAPAYAASTPVYSVASSSAKYEEYPVTSTKVVPETTVVCPTPTVVTYEEKTYSVTKATTLTISSYSTVVIKTTHTPEAPKPSASKPAESKPVYPTSVPAPYPSSKPYPIPSGTGSVPKPPQGTATGYPTTTKPSTPEFTGAAAQAGVGLLAVAGALAAFL